MKPEIDPVPIQDIINTYNYAKNLGLTTVLITARVGFPENIRATINQLTKIGINGYKYIYFRPAYLTDFFTYKEKARKDLEENKKSNILMSIGDMPCDYGKYGGIGYNVLDGKMMFS